MRPARPLHLLAGQPQLQLGFRHPVAASFALRLTSDRAPHTQYEFLEMTLSAARVLHSASLVISHDFDQRIIQRIVREMQFDDGTSTAISRSFTGGLLACELSGYLK